MYRIQGADQKEYGPITADQIRGWVLENRLNRFSLCAGADGVWKPLGQFLEFKELLAQTVAGPGGAGAGAGGGAAMAGSYSGGGMDRDEALRRVQAPAICMIVLAAMGGLMTLASPFMRKAQAGMTPKLPPEMPEFFRQWIARQASGQFGALELGSLIFALVLSAVVIFGAIKMRRLEGYGWGVTAAILTMLPCSACCCLGIPLGIWAILTINGPEVKRHFTS